MNIVPTKKNNTDYKNIYKEYLSEKAKTDSYYLGYRKFLSHKRAKAIFLCYEENTPIGFISIGCLHKSMIIQDLYVNPLYRRKGIAYRLLKSAENKFYNDFAYSVMHCRTDSKPLKDLLGASGYLVTTGKKAIDKTNLFIRYEKKLEHKYKNLIIGIDDLIFDFESSYNFAIKKLFKHYKIKINDLSISGFTKVEQQVLLEYQKGQINYYTYSKQRFRRYFSLRNMNINVDEAEGIFNAALDKYVPLRKHVKSTLTRLSKSYYLVGVSNYKIDYLTELLNKNKLEILFDCLYTADRDEKRPNKALFKLICETHNDLSKQNYCIISSNERLDMEFGLNSKIDTYYLNFKKIKGTINGNIYTRNLFSFKELYHFLKK